MPGSSSGGNHRFILVGELRRKRISDDLLQLLEPRPVAGGNAATAHSVPLQFVPLLQVIDLVLTLFHALRLVLAPFAHHRRNLLPIPSPQVPPVQLRELLRVRLEEAHNRRVAPLLPVLAVLGAAGHGAVRRSRLRSLVVESVRGGSLTDLVALLALLAGATVVVFEGVGEVLSFGNGLGRHGGGDGGGREVVVVRRVGLVEVVVAVVAEEREVVVVVARGHEREDVTASSGTLGKEKENGGVERRCVLEGLTERAFRELVSYVPSRVVTVPLSAESECVVRAFASLSRVGEIWTCW